MSVRSPANDEYELVGALALSLRNARGSGDTDREHALLSALSAVTAALQTSTAGAPLLDQQSLSQFRALLAPPTTAPSMLDELAADRAAALAKAHAATPRIRALFREFADWAKGRGYEPEMLRDRIVEQINMAGDTREYAGGAVHARGWIVSFPGGRQMVTEDAQWLLPAWSCNGGWTGQALKSTDGPVFGDEDKIRDALMAHIRSDEARRAAL